MPKITPLNQEKIIPDAKALEEAYRLFQKPLYRTIYGMTKDHALTQDVFQDLWVYVYSHYNPSDYFKLGKLRWKAKKLVLDAYRYRKRRPTEALTDEVLSMVGVSKEEQTYSVEGDEVLKTKFFGEVNNLGLNEIQITAVWKHLRHGYTLKEISEQMAIPVSTLHEWIKKARQLYFEYYNSK